ncbi:peptide deformylase [Aestuariibius sp. 2305UL40-4]|uniref:peptide deformylase n=1 Tax=Aestuariibius violaceus TaxID=3234132 RepID=UPI00345E1336
MTRPFLRWPDKRLRMAAAPVALVDDEVRAVWDEMIAAMEAMPGIGLAAPQLGVMLRLAVVDASEARAQAVRMANPELVSVSEESVAIYEGSPNLPGVGAEVTRPASCVVRYLDETGVPVERSFDGMWARSVQHQIDHLEGRMYFHRLSRLKRERLLKKAAKGADF